MGIFQKLLKKIKKKSGKDVQPSHRLVYYGDVPLIVSTDDTYLKDLLRGSATSGNSNENNALTGTPGQSKKRNEDDQPPGQGGPATGNKSMRSVGTLPSQQIREIPAVQANLQQPRNPDFVPNVVQSSRYTCLNFVPKNLFEQFSRAANFYFLVMAIIQSSIRSPVHPFTAAVPLLFVIVTTAVKQGYEDWLRHKADANVNNRPVCVVRDDHLVAIKSKDVIVGDIIRLEGEDQVPADILVMGSSDEFLRCQITTANLDGETNLKMRYCPAGLLHLKHERDFRKLHVILECEQPNASLYEFNGCLLVPPHRTPTSRTSESAHSFPNNGSKIQNSFASSFGTSRTSGRQSMTSAGRKSGKSNVNSTHETTFSSFFTVPLSMENMVLRGARVKNTEFIFGLVVYTGKDTRLAQNSKQTNLKFSTCDKTQNRYLAVFISALVIMLSISNGCHYWFESSDVISKAYYLGPSINFLNTSEQIREGVQILASFLILFNYIIPISLYVTVELQKFFGSKFFVWDLEMTCPISGHPPLCNTSDINDELGQIEYLFTDKTGTLTENIMQFRYCSVGGVNYDFVDECLFLHENTTVKTAGDEPILPVDIVNSPEIVSFLKVLALCHSVQLMPIRRPSFESSGRSTVTTSTLGRSSTRPVKDAKMRAASSLFSLGGKSEHAVGILGKWEYQASSPDEKALLESCYKLDVKYLGDREDILTLDSFGTADTYKRHFVLEFDADRKCMSVIVENQEGEIWLFCKGAESTIIPRCTEGPSQEVLKSVVDFAMMGMRTLAVAKRKLTRDELKRFSHKLKAARRLLKGRDEAMRDLYRSVERDLMCVGATGVEDQLQQGVPEMLQAINAAGIRVWMLTGDKIETGVSVGVACGLITQSTKQYFLTNGTDKEAIQAHLELIKKEVTSDDNTTLILDGSTIELAFSTCPDLLRLVSLSVYRVICCRMAPLQKAQIVHMVKTSETSPITAAVGDGANDVAMIQEAHIGIGILGKEGRQAARCADFALARSSFLKKAILVHGHWFYLRLAILVIYFFYKNIVFIGPQFIYSFYSACSTQALYDGWSLMMFNIFYASCPIFTFGIQEQPYTAKTLMEHPYLYTVIRRNSFLTWQQFTIWCLFAVWHAIVCFYVPYFSWSFFTPISDWSSFGTLCYCCVIGVVNTKLALETKFFSRWTVFSFAFSFGSMIFFCSLYSEGNLDYYLHPSFLPPGEYRHVYFTLLSKLSFWLVVIIVQLIAFAPDLLYKAYTNSSFKFEKFYRSLPRKMGKGLRRNRHLPLRLSMLFTKRTGKLAVSTATLQSYLSRQDVA